MRVFGIIVLLCAPLFGQAMSDELASELVRKAEAAYAEGDVVSALALYDSVAVDHVSPALLYNIGNCHFKQGDLAHAILYYERSLVRDPGAEDVRANLDLARSLLRDRINEVPSIGLAPLWDRLSGGLSVDRWAWSSFIALLLACLAWALVITRTGPGPLRSTLRIAGAVLGLVAIIGVAMAAYRHGSIHSSDKAIIMHQKIEVHSEPRENSTVQVQLHEGTKVELLQQRNGWTEVRLENGTVGWTPTASLEPI